MNAHQYTRKFVSDLRQRLELDSEDTVKPIHTITLTRKKSTGGEKKFFLMSKIWKEDALFANMITETYIIMGSSVGDAMAFSQTNTYFYQLVQKVRPFTQTQKEEYAAKLCFRWT